MINRSLLIGFGIGLVFSAGFLSIFPVESVNLTLSKEQLEAYAKSQNFVLLPKEQYEELTKGKKQEKQPTKAPIPPAKPTDTTAPQPVDPPSSVKQPGTVTPPETVPPSSVNRPSANQPTTPQKPATPVEIVTITIPYKATGVYVSKRLVDAGLLPKNNDFVALLEEQNKLGRIRVGTFRIPKGTSAQDIIRIITTPPAY